jgi:MFS family permease
MDGHASTAYKGPQTALPGARSALILLLAINLFNYIDRQVLAAVEPEIRKELLPHVDDKEARTLMGLLSSAFLVTYMLIAPVFGWMAERIRRWLLVGIGVVLWSLASGASGWDWGEGSHSAFTFLGIGLTLAFTLLLLTRCFVGVGEGAYGPVAPTMLSDLYPIKDRGRVLAWFYLAIPVGGALGYALGEVVKDLYGWRWAFFVVVPPGLLLGLWCFLMHEPPRGQADLVDPVPSGPAGQANADAAGPLRRATRRDYLNLLKNRSYVLNTLGMAAMTFAIGGLAFWMPDYLDERKAPGLMGLGPRTTFGAITAVSGLLATLLGGMAGDWLRTRFSGSYFLVSGVAMLSGFPMLLCFLWTPFPVAWFFVFLAVFCLFFNTGPTNTILANVTHPSIRASAFALNILVIHLLGDVISPPLVGFIQGTWDMNTGFVVVSLLMLVGGLLWLWGARYLEHDTARAPTSLAPADGEPGA